MHRNQPNLHKQTTSRTPPTTPAHGRLPRRTLPPLHARLQRARLPKRPCARSQASPPTRSSGCRGATASAGTSRKQSFAIIIIIIIIDLLLLLLLLVLPLLLVRPSHRRGRHRCWVPYLEQKHPLKERESVLNLPSPSQTTFPGRMRVNRGRGKHMDPTTSHLLRDFSF